MARCKICHGFALNPKFGVCTRCLRNPNIDLGIRCIDCNSSTTKRFAGNPAWKNIKGTNDYRCWDCFFKHRREAREAQPQRQMSLSPIKVFFIILIVAVSATIFWTQIVEPTLYERDRQLAQQHERLIAQLMEQQNRTIDVVPIQ